MHNVFLAALQSDPLMHLYPPALCGGGDRCDRAPVLAFADDTLILFKNLSYSQVLKISYSLSLIAKVTGLAVNLSKSKILCQGDSPSNLNLIGENVSILRHLGVFLSLSWKEAYDAMYAEIISKLEKKAGKLKFYTKDNILKRRMVILAFMETQALHVMRIFPPRPDHAKQMLDLTEKAIWGGESQSGTSSDPAPSFQGGVGNLESQRKVTSGFSQCIGQCDGAYFFL